MNEAAVDRLVRLISDYDHNNPENDGYRRKPFEVHMRLAEGWFSLFLVATVVYSAIWCVQAVGWVDHLNILTLTTAIGLIIGVVAAKQQRFSRALIHAIVIGFGLLLSFWQTAGAFYHGDTAMLAHATQNWFVVVTHGGIGEEDSIFLFFITALGYMLAYMSAWLVYRTRSPWLMIVANAVVLLINLSAVDNGYVIFLVVFLIASLLLLLRFNLYESVKRWQRQGLRYADDIGWDVMQTGALVSISILIFSWILPAGYTDPTTSQVWNMNANPWIQLENTWNRIISVQGGVNPSNRGNFRDMLVLGGNPNLNHDIVFTVQSEDSSQYLASISYDTYTRQGWLPENADSYSLKANQSYENGAALTHTLQQRISVVNPPGEQYAYLFGSPQITSTNLPAIVLLSRTTGEVVAWISQAGYLTSGANYTVISTVSSADEKTLRTVPLPADAPRYVPQNADESLPPTYYNPEIVRAYTQLPNDLDPAISALAKRITARAPTMYDKAMALESYLRTNYTYSVDIQRPSNEEAVSWFLFHSGNKGFCNYFASAMAIMARSLGMPARVVAGYTNGEYDARHHQQVIRGTDAHSWTQIYFAGYGWINFEPSTSFATFTRPQPNQYPVSSVGSLGGNQGNNAGAIAAGKNNHIRLDPADASVGSNGGDVQQSGQLSRQVGMLIGGFILLLLCACALFSIWWGRLFRRHSLAAQLYGRICLLANWAGIQMQPSQTPHEYVQELVQATPQDASLLERLGDIYVRERWADPQSNEHPGHNGELRDLPGIWRQLQPHLFFYVLRHPHFLRRVPQRVGRLLAAVLASRRAKHPPHDEEW